MLWLKHQCLYWKIVQDRSLRIVFLPFLLLCVRDLEPRGQARVYIPMLAELYDGLSLATVQVYTPAVVTFRVWV